MVSAARPPPPLHVVGQARAVTDENRGDDGGRLRGTRCDIPGGGDAHVPAKPGSGLVPPGRRRDGDERAALDGSGEVNRAV